jgi:hypothetical protein
MKLSHRVGFKMAAPRDGPMAGGLGMNGTMMMIGAVGAFTVDSPDLPRRRAAVKG